jgi:hypothetical protein
MWLNQRPVQSRNQTQSPWLASARTDSLGILLPPFAVCLLVALLPPPVRNSSLSPWTWLLLVVCIDVAHVYTTLFRTYFHPTGRLKYRRQLWLIPLVGFWVSAALHAYDPIAFWRVLAYLAVFHFIRQQYGFLRLYSRHEQHRPPWTRVLDAAAIYAATLYPLVYWHLSGNRSFVWFLEGDFFPLHYPLALPFAQLAWLCILGSYFLKEIFFCYQEKALNLPKQLVLAGTVLTWYLGIVVWNSDVAFTATNVVSHGIPYATLIWIRNQQEKKSTPATLLGWRATLVGIVGVSLLAAILEESLWDVWVWQDHKEVFAFANYLPSFPTALIWVLVPLLTLPQLTHYVLDGFIWRRPKNQITL